MSKNTTCSLVFSLLMFVMDLLTIGEAALTCLSCEDALLPTGCATIQRCGEHDMCFVEVYVDSLGQARYRLGCRDTQLCSVVRPDTKRTVDTAMFEPDLPHKTRREDRVVCSECCNGTVCNNYGCNAGGFGDRTERGPICYQCAEQTTTDNCNNIEICGRDQVCAVRARQSAIGHLPEYESLCEEKTTCDSTLSAIAIVGRRSSNHSTSSDGRCLMQCCDEDLCNTGCGNSTTAHNSPTHSVTSYTSTTSEHTMSLPVSATSPPVSATPQHLTTTVTSKPTSSASQTASVSQQTLTTKTAHHPTPTKPSNVFTSAPPNPCLSNPCAYGNCSVSADNAYTCSCKNGYFGQNCDNPVPTTIPEPTKPTTVILEPTTGFPKPTTAIHVSTTKAPEQTTTEFLEPTKSDPCFPDPCVYGNCSVISGTFSCTCEYDVYGRNCDKMATTTTPASTASTTAAPYLPACLSNPCMHGTCIDVPELDTYSCTCPDGYYGRNCGNFVTSTAPVMTTTVNPCLSNPCFHGDCTVLFDTYACACPDGYYGRHCENFASTTTRKTTPSTTTHKTTPSTTTSMTTTSTTTTTTTPSTTTAVNACSSNPCLHGTCGFLGSFHYCVCFDNWRGTDCDEPIDPSAVAQTTTVSVGHFQTSACDLNPCANGVCDRNGTSFTCLCDAGFTGTHCDVTVSITTTTAKPTATTSTCQSHLCSHGNCIKVFGAFYCICDDGFTGEHCDKVSDPTVACQECKDLESEACGRLATANATFCSTSLVASKYCRVTCQLCNCTATWPIVLNEGEIDTGKITSASGLAASRRHPGYLYTHNDDEGGHADIYVIDTRGHYVATFRIGHAHNVDWEDIAVGPCQKGNNDEWCIYIGDFGGHGGGSPANIIYRVKEPDTIGNHHISADALHFRWSWKNTNTLMVDPEANLYIIAAHKHIAKIPNTAWDDTDVEITIRTNHTINIDVQETLPYAGDISRDGTGVLVKTLSNILYWYAGTSRDYISLLETPGKPVNYLTRPEPHGEAVCWDSEGIDYFTLGEGDHKPLYRYVHV